jgi:flagellar hook-associated protein 2
MPALEYFMGSISSSLTNTPVTTAGSNNANTTFKGASTYSSDFQNVISRAVAIASLPLNLLTTQQTTLTDQSKELTTLDTKFTALQTAVQNVDTALGGSSFQTAVSTPNVVGVNVADGAREGVYSINVKDIGAYETSNSTRNWNVPEASTNTPTTFTLVVGNRNYSITGADNSAQSVVDAINSTYGSIVQATTVNVAPGDTRISLKSAALGPTNLDILQVPVAPAVTTSLQGQAATGYAISQTTATWDDSGSTPATYTLTIGGDTHSITPASNSADDVATEINAQYGSQVRATVIDLGTSDNPDTRISLQSVAANPSGGSMVLDLQKAGGPSLQTQQGAATSRTTLSWNGADDAAGSRSTYNLMFGAIPYSFTPADNSAASVSSAINSLYGSQVKASVVDFGTGDHHDYRISLQSLTGSSASLDLQKTIATNYQKEQTQGSLASYEMNGSGVISTSTTRDIKISDGITATLLAISGTSPTATTPVDITVTRSISVLGTALSAFADAYNAAVDEIDTQRGQGAGALAAQSVVSRLSGILSSISTFSSDGQVSGLNKDLGLELQTNGHLTYTALQFMSADLASSTGITSFFGSAASGGFLKNATDLLNSVEDPTTGLLKTAETDWQSQITKIGTTIAAKQSQIDALQIQLQNQMAVSDALIASMQQQASYLTSLFAAQDTADQMYK